MKLSVLFPDESEHEREVPRDLHLDRGTVGPAGAKAESVQRGGSWFSASSFPPRGWDPQAVSPVIISTQWNSCCTYHTVLGTMGNGRKQRLEDGGLDKTQTGELSLQI